MPSGGRSWKTGPLRAQRAWRALHSRMLPPSLPAWVACYGAIVVDLSGRATTDPTLLGQGAGHPLLTGHLLSINLPNLLVHHLLFLDHAALHWRDTLGSRKIASRSSGTSSSRNRLDRQDPWAAGPLTHACSTKFLQKYWHTPSLIPWLRVHSTLNHRSQNTPTWLLLLWMD